MRIPASPFRAKVSLGGNVFSIVLMKATRDAALLTAPALWRICPTV
jgi:hypothetical protein